MSHLRGGRPWGSRGQGACCFTFQTLPTTHRPSIPLHLPKRDLWRITKFLRETGYQADLPACRSSFPGLLTFSEFLAATGWADPGKTFEEGIQFGAGGAKAGGVAAVAGKE